ncbi:MAG: alpha/beta hydrolase [Pseudohongiellaceae bacterium]|nr:alpha/beta hydrolase [Pseudohongiellaceae bacterium]
MKNNISTLLLFLAYFTSFASFAAETRIEIHNIYGHKDGMAMYYNVEIPKNPNGIGVIFIVSGGWLSGTDNLNISRPFWEIMLDKGYTLFQLYHPGMPTYKIPDAYEGVRLGVKTILAEASDFGISQVKMGVFGISSGGHLSLLTAFDAELQQETEELSHSIGAAVAFMPPTDLKGGDFDQILFGASPMDFDPALISSLSPIDRVTAAAPPTIIIHGTKDAAVDYRRNSVRLFETLQAKAVPSKLVPIDAGHEVFPEAQMTHAQKEYLTWLEEHLQ